MVEQQMKQLRGQSVRRLRSLFDMHHVPFGASANLRGLLLNLLHDRHFAMDFWSLVNSLGESGDGLPEEEVFETVIESVTGHDSSALPAYEGPALSEMRQMIAGVDVNRPVETPEAPPEPEDAAALLPHKEKMAVYPTMNPSLDGPKERDEANALLDSSKGRDDEASRRRQLIGDTLARLEQSTRELREQLLQINDQIAAESAQDAPVAEVKPTPKVKPETAPPPSSPLMRDKERKKEKDDVAPLQRNEATSHNIPDNTRFAPTEEESSVPDDEQSSSPLTEALPPPRRSEEHRARPEVAWNSARTAKTPVEAERVASAPVEIEGRFARYQRMRDDPDTEVEADEEQPASFLAQARPVEPASADVAPRVRPATPVQPFVPKQTVAEPWVSPPMPVQPPVQERIATTPLVPPATQVHPPVREPIAVEPPVPPRTPVQPPLPEQIATAPRVAAPTVQPAAATVPSPQAIPSPLRPEQIAAAEVFTPRPANTLSQRGLATADDDDDPRIVAPRLAGYADEPRRGSGAIFGIAAMVLAVLALGGFLAWQTDPGRDFLQHALAGLQGGANSVTKSAEASTPAPTTSNAPSTVTAKTPTPEVTATPSGSASANPATPPAANSAPAVSSPPTDTPVAKRAPKRAVEEVETLGEEPPRSREPFVDTSVARVPAVTMAANLLTSRAPVYPELARTLQIQGPVTLEILVTSTGAVRHAQMIDGDRRLAVAAQEAVRRWRYKPYLLNGEPVDVTTTVRLDFRLPDE